MKITRIQQLGVLAPHLQIRDDMLNLLQKKTWKPGELIPSENQLAEKYAVSRLTIRKALKHLEDDGILQARQGSGRIVMSTADFAENTTKSIGVICSQFGSSYGEVELLDEMASQKGYEIHLYLLQNIASKNTLNQQIKQMLNDQHAGIIILCRDIIGEQLLEWKRFIPIVAIYQDFSMTGITSFTIDWRWSAQQAAKLLFEKGFQEHLILLNELPFFRNVNKMIVEGFNYTYMQYNKKINFENLFLIPSFHQNDRLKYLEKVYEKIEKKQKCAIISYWNWPFARLLEFCQNNNKNIPEDIALIALTDSSELRNLNQPISAFEYDRNELVKKAFNAMIKKIEGKQDEVNSQYLNCIYGKFIQRNTT